MPETLFSKIWNEHLIRPTQAGGLIFVDRVLLHERTGGIALQNLAKQGRKVMAPGQVFATMDHVVETRPGRDRLAKGSPGAPFIEATREGAHAAGIQLFDIGDPRQGIVHVIGPELGIVLPGLTLVCPDSHTGTQGALGALAWGIGSTEAEHVLATQTLQVTRPRTMRVRIDGALHPGVTAKDLALLLIGKYGAAGARDCVVEFAGQVIEQMDLESRMTLCNMGTEFSAFTSIIAPDDTTFRYLRNRMYAPAGDDWERALQQWQTLRSDVDAHFDFDIDLDASDAYPMVTWGTNPQQVVPIHGRVPLHSEVAERQSADNYERVLAYMGLQPGLPLAGLPIDAAFIGSCTNSRLGDLRRAAALLKGRSVAPGVRALCVPGSSQVRRRAEAEGLHEIFQRAGFEWRESGCSLCFSAGADSFLPGQRVISSTNRNFEGRQGPGSRTHLASPETVAASAIAGCIADPRGQSQ